MGGWEAEVEAREKGLLRRQLPRPADEQVADPRAFPTPVKLTKGPAPNISFPSPFEAAGKLYRLSQSRPRQFMTCPRRDILHVAQAHQSSPTT